MKRFIEEVALFIIIVFVYTFIPKKLMDRSFLFCIFPGLGHPPLSQDTG